MTDKQSKEVFEVAELFAGVGGFKIGLEKASSKNNQFKVTWSNQWEPSTTTQHASKVYKARFPKANHSSDDIAKVESKNIPNHDLLVGGFPCQDYSVASTLKHSGGLGGKKGVLWWEIVRILKDKGNMAPKYLMLENVDRLLKSPSKQRGRDFAVMLASLSDIGYAVEWRVINAAEFGMPQRRKRIYILGYRKNTELFKSISKAKAKATKNWLLKDGIFAKSFKATTGNDKPREFLINGTLDVITKEFDYGKKSPFENSGLMINRKVTTAKLSSDYKGKYISLKDILQDEKDVAEEFYIDEKSDLGLWKTLKGAKNQKRKTKDGFEYTYSEGSMTFPDNLNTASRTIVTGEGGKAPSRFKHVIRTKDGRLRRLTPFELEKLNMFPANHTKLDGITDTKRAFFMGNALVVGVIQKLGKTLLDNI